MPSSGIARSHGSFTSRFLRNLHTVLLTVCINLIPTTDIFILVISYQCSSSFSLFDLDINNHFLKKLFLLSFTI